jgi:hypothetical protein
MPEITPERSLSEIQADAALALELVGRFFAGQIDAGAVLQAEIAAHITSCADAVADRMPLVSHHIAEQAHAMIARLPAGWAEGDDPEWQEPA